MQRFEGKVALITGAASGMGRATAIRLASEGAGVYGTDVNAEGLAKTRDEVESAGGEMRSGLFDVGDRDACFASVGEALDAFGRLDVLCNIAGILRVAHAHEMSVEDWNSVIATNLSGPFFMCQAAIPHLLETHGNIVGVASNAGLMGQAYTAAYCASKGGLVNLTRALAWEYMKRPIRINAVAPSGTETNLAADANFGEDIDPSLMDRFYGMRGMSQPEEIAGAIAYLASDEAKSVHGAIWTLDNGITAG